MQHRECGALGLLLWFGQRCHARALRVEPLGAADLRPRLCPEGDSCVSARAWRAAAACEGA
eukprot:2437777-Prymnesium_polylepis.1